MSQAKVDKYKEEKKNRQKTMKLTRIRNGAIIVVVFMGIGALIGIPIGKKAYNMKQEKDAANATISADKFDLFFKEYYVANYATFFDTETDDHSDLADLISTDTDSEPADEVE